MIELTNKEIIAEIKRLSELVDCPDDEFDAIAFVIRHLIAADRAKREPLSKSVSPTERSASMLREYLRRFHPTYAPSDKSDICAWALRVLNGRATMPVQQARAPDGWKWVPVRPTDAHLGSMAMRYSHDYGMLDAEQQAGMRVTMRQLYEEAIGDGFYKIAAAPTPPREAKP